MERIFGDDQPESSDDEVNYVDITANDDASDDHTTYSDTSDGEIPIYDDQSS